MAKDDNEKVLVTVGIAAAAYLFVIKPLMSSLGVDPADKATIDAQVQADPTANPFNPLYQGAVDLFNANPSTNSDGSTMTMAQYYPLIKQLYDSNDPSLTGYAKAIAQDAETLYSLLNGWHLTTDTNAVMAVFNSIVAKTQLANVAAYYYYNFGSDLYTSLQGSLFKFGLAPSDLAALTTKMNNLPDQ